MALGHAQCHVPQDAMVDGTVAHRGQPDLLLREVADLRYPLRHVVCSSGVPEGSRVGNTPTSTGQVSPRP